MKTFFKLLWACRIITTTMVVLIFLMMQVNGAFANIPIRMLMSLFLALAFVMFLIWMVMTFDRIESNFHKFTYNSYTKTIRTEPESYWVATVNPDRTLKFDSWDKAIVGRYSQLEIRIKWRLGLIPHKGINYVNDDNLMPEQKAWLERANCEDNDNVVYIINGKVVTHRL